MQNPACLLLYIGIGTHPLLLCCLCSNLGHLYQQWQRRDKAEAILIQGYDRMIATLNAVELPVAFRWQSIPALRELMMQMSSFYPDLDQTISLDLVMGKVDLAVTTTD